MHLLRTLALAGTMLLVTAPAFAQQKPELPKPGKPAQIVFVGNSYTHYHDLPAFVRAIGAADEPRRELTTVMLAPGGLTLQGHWHATGDRAPGKVIGNERPDFVVLQEQSRMPFENPKQMQSYAKKFGRLIKKKKSIAVWYMTWARQADPERQDEISEQYELAQKHNGGLLAPVGRAWQAIRKQHPEQSLHNQDGSHPSPSGTYVAACVLYGTMFGADVSNLPDKLTVADADGKTKTLIDLSPEEGKRLRTAASEALAANGKPRSKARPVK